MVASTLLAPAAAQAAEIKAMTEAPCCPDDCPPQPECGPACTALMQCRAALATIPLETGLEQSIDTYGAMTFAMADVTSNYSVLEMGLRRPPKV